MIVWLGVWAAAAAALFVRYLRPRESPGAGLVLAYFSVFFMMHAFSGVVVLQPWYSSADPDADRAGLAQSALGATAFTAAVLGFLAWRKRRQRIEERALSPKSASFNPARPDSIRPAAWLLAGLGAYFVLRPFAGRIPTMTALLSMASLLVVIAICLFWLHNYLRRKTVPMTAWTAAAAVLPFGTLLLEGFLGFGVAMLIIVLCFVASIYRPRRWVATGAVLATYLLLSLYVTYMTYRGDLRASIWGGDPLERRVEAIAEALTEFEWLDPTNPYHLEMIDSRMNQNRLVGGAVHRLEVTDDYAKGDTILRALLALVPRAIWPDKTIQAGSEGLVTQYTGIHFAEGTSVGMGQVFEFYINFGTVGVIAGFAVFGLLVAFLDARAVDRLREGNWNGFVMAFLPGLGLLQAGGSLVEMTASSAAGFIVAAGFVRILARKPAPSFAMSPDARL